MGGDGDDDDADAEEVCVGAAAKYAADIGCANDDKEIGRLPSSATFVLRTPIDAPEEEVGETAVVDMGCSADEDSDDDDSDDDAAPAGCDDGSCCRLRCTPEGLSGAMIGGTCRCMVPS